MIRQDVVRAKNDWERYVTPKLPELVKKLNPSSLLEELLACGLLTSEDCSTLRHGCLTEEDRSRKLLYDLLPRRGNDAFDRFCQVIGRGVAQGFPEGFPNLTSLISVVNMIIA